MFPAFCCRIASPIVLDTLLSLSLSTPRAKQAQLDLEAAMSMAKLRIAINGFGRIGRTILRQILTNPAHADIEIVAINDIAPHQTCAYLFQYDSVFGPFPQPVRLQDGA